MGKHRAMILMPSYNSSPANKLKMSVNNMPEINGMEIHLRIGKLEQRLAWISRNLERGSNTIGIEGIRKCLLLLDSSYLGT
jgi:hypothetical protein